jgi:hypothetical protein
MNQPDAARPAGFFHARNFAEETAGVCDRIPPVVSSRAIVEQKRSSLAAILFPRVGKSFSGCSVKKRSNQKKRRTTF